MITQYSYLCSAIGNTFRVLPNRKIHWYIYLTCAISQQSLKSTRFSCECHKHHKRYSLRIYTHTRTNVLSHFMCMESKAFITRRDSLCHASALTNTLSSKKKTASICVRVYVCIGVCTRECAIERAKLNTQILTQTRNVEKQNNDKRTFSEWYIRAVFFTSHHRLFPFRILCIHIWENGRTQLPLCERFSASTSHLVGKKHFRNSFYLDRSGVYF